MTLPKVWSVDQPTSTLDTHANWPIDTAVDRSTVSSHANNTPSPTPHGTNRAPSISPAGPTGSLLARQDGMCCRAQALSGPRITTPPAAYHPCTPPNIQPRVKGNTINPSADSMEIPTKPYLLHLTHTNTTHSPPCLLRLGPRP